MYLRIFCIRVPPGSPPPGGTRLYPAAAIRAGFLSEASLSQSRPKLTACRFPAFLPGERSGRPWDSTWTAGNEFRRSLRDACTPLLRRGAYVPVATAASVQIRLSSDLPVPRQAEAHRNGCVVFPLSSHGSKAGALGISPGPPEVNSAGPKVPLGRLHAAFAARGLRPSRHSRLRPNPSSVRPPGPEAGRSSPQ